MTEESEPLAYGAAEHAADAVKYLAGLVAENKAAAANPDNEGFGVGTESMANACRSVAEALLALIEERLKAAPPVVPSEYCIVALQDRRWHLRSTVTADLSALLLLNGQNRSCICRAPILLGSSAPPEPLYEWSQTGAVWVSVDTEE